MCLPPVAASVGVYCWGRLVCLLVGCLVGPMVCHLVGRQMESKGKPHCLPGPARSQDRHSQCSAHRSHNPHTLRNPHSSNTLCSPRSASKVGNNDTPLGPRSRCRQRNSGKSRKSRIGRNLGICGNRSIQRSCSSGCNDLGLHRPSKCRNGQSRLGLCSCRRQRIRCRPHSPYIGRIDHSGRSRRNLCSGSIQRIQNSWCSCRNQCSHGRIRNQCSLYNGRICGNRSMSQCLGIQISQCNRRNRSDRGSRYSPWRFRSCNNRYIGRNLRRHHNVHICIVRPSDGSRSILRTQNNRCILRSQRKHYSLRSRCNERRIQRNQRQYSRCKLCKTSSCLGWRSRCSQYNCGSDYNRCCFVHLGNGHNFLGLGRTYSRCNGLNLQGLRNRGSLCNCGIPCNLYSLYS